MSSEIFLGVVLPVILFSSLTIYFRLAMRWRIMDVPSERSSHSIPTVRGGGIIFPITALVWFVHSGGHHTLFLAGFLVAAFVSFGDDLRPLPVLVRLMAHMMAMALVFYEVQFSGWPIVLILSAFIVSVGALSAFNFMDGINGISGLQALVTLVVFWFINSQVVTFTHPELIASFLIATVIFLFFNFRKRARCFAGDVGSVSLAMLQIFLLLDLIQQTQYLGWVMLVLVFGLDSVVTLVERIRKGEKLWLPHRTHMYQYLANELQTDHRWIATAYASAQMVISLLVILAFQAGRQSIPWLIGGVGFVVYIGLRRAVLQKIRLKEIR